MKLKFLIPLLIFTSCQTYNSGLSSDLSESLKSAANPTLLALQFLTIEMKQEKGEWADSVTDYKKTFNSSINVLLSEFTEIQFKHQNDTLLILYKLNDPLRVTNYDIDFVDPQLYTDSAKVKFESRAKSVNNKNVFKENEGRLIFVERSNYVSVIHEYRGGVSNNKITTVQQ